MSGEGVAVNPDPEPWGVVRDDRSSVTKATTNNGLTQPSIGSPAQLLQRLWVAAIHPYRWRVPTNFKAGWKIDWLWQAWRRLCSGLSGA